MNDQKTEAPTDGAASRLALETGSEIEMNVRSAHPPYDTWPATGHMPFEIHGERFAVTRIPCTLNDAQQWRVSHVETGAACPRTIGATIEEALANGKATLAEVGPDKLKASLAKVRSLFPNIPDEPRSP